MTWAVRVEWTECKPCRPGTTEHDPSIGKWYVAGTAWATTNSEIDTFACYEDALGAAIEMRGARRHAHPPFTLIVPARYEVTSTGEIQTCNTA